MAVLILFAQTKTAQDSFGRQFNQIFIKCMRRKKESFIRPLSSVNVILSCNKNYQNAQQIQYFRRRSCEYRTFDKASLMRLISFFLICTFAHRASLRLARHRTPKHCATINIQLMGAGICYVDVISPLSMLFAGCKVSRSTSHEKNYYWMPFRWEYNPLISIFYAQFFWRWCTVCVASRAQRIFE